MLKKCASRIYMVLIFAFLYLPIIVLIALSFNDSRSKVKWGGFTLRWYTGCFQDEKIMTAFVTTLQVTFLSAIISTLIGTLAALGMAAAAMAPMTMPAIAMFLPLVCGRPLLCAKATMPKMMPSSEPAGPNTKQMKYSGSAISELTSDPIAMPSLDLGAGYDEYSGGGR